MGLQASMDAMRDYLADSKLTGIDDDNCVVEDEGVFNEILMRDDETGRRVCMIGYNGIDRPRNQKSEFGGSLVIWKLRVTLFFLMWDDIEERVGVIHDSMSVVDELFNAINEDSTLGGEVMDSYIDYGDEPKVYTRQQMNEYFMLVFYVNVTENIY